MTKKLFFPTLLIFLVMGGIALVAYPLVSNTLYEQNQSHVVAAYGQMVEKADQETISDALSDAHSYNRSLLEANVMLTEPFDQEAVLDPTVEPYASLLNIGGDGIMGYVEIPSIDVYLPIYHGTTADVLERGVGHLQSTSLPVGGADTHSVLTAHTGLAGKRLFTDLIQVEVGERFYLHILDEILAYQVDEIHIVEPHETERLVVSPGEDLVTLVTCHPYGVNTHRLLVRGRRIDYEPPVMEEAAPSSGQTHTKQSVWRQEYQKALLLCLAIYLPLTILLLWLTKHRRKKQGGSPRDNG